MIYFNQEQIRLLDELAVQNGLEIRQMMELAGWHMVRLMQEIGVPRDAKITILCGKGNKGGDGLSAARHLANYGWKVTVILLSREISPDATHHLQLVEKMRIPIMEYPEESQSIEKTIVGSDILIDALIGYNLDGAPRGPFRDVIRLMNTSGKTVIAYDLPSGLHATTGECFDPCINAGTTLSLAAPKKGLETDSGRTVAGNIFVADIGIPEFIYNQVITGSRPSFKDGLVKLN